MAIYETVLFYLGRTLTLLLGWERMKVLADVTSHLFWHDRFPVGEYRMTLTLTPSFEPSTGLLYLHVPLHGRTRRRLAANCAHLGH